MSLRATSIMAFWIDKYLTLPYFRRLVCWKVAGLLVGWLVVVVEVDKITGASEKKQASPMAGTLGGWSQKLAGGWVETKNKGVRIFFNLCVFVFLY